MDECSYIIVLLRLTSQIAEKLVIWGPLFWSCLWQWRSASSKKCHCHNNLTFTINDVAPCCTFIIWMEFLSHIKPLCRWIGEVAIPSGHSFPKKKLGIFNLLSTSKPIFPYYQGESKIFDKGNFLLQTHDTKNFVDLKSTFSLFPRWSHNFLHSLFNSL